MIITHCRLVFFSILENIQKRVTGNCLCDRNEKSLPDDVNVTAINVFERCDKKIPLDTITDNEDHNFDIKNKKA